MTTHTTLARQAAEAIQEADFRGFWPIKVRKALVRAAQTEGTFPLYAERETRWALKAASAIEHRMNKDIEVGVASLSQSDKRRLVVSR